MMKADIEENKTSLSAFFIYHILTSNLEKTNQSLETTKSNLEANTIGTNLEISLHIGTDYFTIPSDGYVNVLVYGTEISYNGRLRDSNNNEICIVCTKGVGNYFNSSELFVRKGMKFSMDVAKPNDNCKVFYRGLN